MAVVVSLVGFGLGVYVARTSSDTSFQECLFAAVFVQPADRAKLTEQKLEDVCHIDGKHVQNLRDQLTQ